MRHLALAADVVRLEIHLALGTGTDGFDACEGKQIVRSSKPMRYHVKFRLERRKEKEMFVKKRSSKLETHQTSHILGQPTTPHSPGEVQGNNAATAARRNAPSC